MVKNKNTIRSTGARNQYQRSTGFTIVELSVVIVVLGILASIIIFSVGSWRTRVAETEIKSDLNSVVAAMESVRNFSNGYPTDPKFDGTGAIFQQSGGVLISYESGDTKGYCIEAQSKVKSSIAFFVKSPDKTPIQGTCAGGAGAVPTPMSPEYMVFVFDTSAPGCDGTVRLPLTTLSGKVHWGDGVVDSVSGDSYYARHTYEKRGVYVASYAGKFPSMMGYVSTPPGSECITQVKQWPNNNDIKSISRVGGPNIEYVAEPPKSVTSMKNMFTGAKVFNQPIGDWDVSNVTDMSNMFVDAKVFNQPIGAWNVRNVASMSAMFSGAKVFNQPIGDWDVSNVTNMSHMFSGATSFNQSIGSWNTGKVVSMASMFTLANSFNQPIGNWDVSNVTNMSYMFSSDLRNGRVIFNQPIGNWDVSSVINMRYMFNNTSVFNQPIGNWDVSSVTDMSYMFSNSIAFNQPIESWNVGGVTTMHGMFASSRAFNQPLGGWNTSGVSKMNSMFSAATAFNQDLSNWDVSSIASPSDYSFFDTMAYQWLLSRPNFPQ